MSRILQDNRRRKKEDQPYGRRRGKKDLGDVLSKRVNPDLPTGVELRAYEEKYRQLKQEDIKHLARYGYLPADFKNRKGNEEIIEDPGIKKLMRSEEVEDGGAGKPQAGEKEMVDLTGEDEVPTFRTPEEREEMKKSEVKTKLKNIRSKQVKLQEKRKVRETDEEEKETDRKQEPQAKVVKESKTPEKLRKPSGNSGPAESKGRSSEQEVRGRTMERGREKGPNSRRHRKGQRTSGLQSKERKRTESPVSTRRPAGLFSDVKDNITGGEELDTDDDYENDTEDEESE